MLDDLKLEIAETVDARKVKIESDGTADVFKGASQIIVAKGKKTLEFSTEQIADEDFFKAILGRSGTLRAPTLKIGTKFLVGYNDDLIKSNI